MSERISPAELIAEAYERLPIEDQLSLGQFSDDARPASESGPRLVVEEDSSVTASRRPPQIGDEFSLAAPTIEYGNPEIIAFTLPNPRPGRLLDLNWETFGYGTLCTARGGRNRRRPERFGTLAGLRSGFDGDHQSRDGPAPEVHRRR